MIKKRVLVISSANIDFVQKMRRVPYSGETVVEDTSGYSYIPGGKGANSAIAFSRLGADCVFVCKLGKDANGRRLISIYEKEGIDTRYILEDPDHPTGLASILVEENGKNRIIVYPGANFAFAPEDTEEAFNCYPDALYMQLEIPAPTIIEATRRANAAGIPVFIDAGPANVDFPLEQLGKVEVFSPNETETRVFTGITPNSEENCLRACIKLASMVDAKYIVLKLGDKGCFLYDGKEYYTFPAEQVEAVDTTAAGDVFTAALTYWYLEKGNILKAADFAGCAAGISVSREGASPSVPTLSEVIAFARNRNEQRNQEQAAAEEGESAE
ncbi:MAG: ribokinase [Clostridia bacterium]|nr:ribokinase [Clostridia bacterium]